MFHLSLFDIASALLFSLLPQNPTPIESRSATAAVPPALEVRVPLYNNPSCPIMGKPISTKLFTDTEKGRIYICCKSCIKDIRDDVETAHKTAYPVIKKLGNLKCPVSGKPIDKDSPTVVLQGYEISVADAEQAAKLRANAQVYLARMLEPDLDDLENEVCPVTNDAVVPNAYCLIGKTLVRLSSPQCVEQVEPDASRVLQRALGLRGKRSTGVVVPEKRG